MLTELPIVAEVRQSWLTGWCLGTSAYVLPLVTESQLAADPDDPPGDDELDTTDALEQVEADVARDRAQRQATLAAATDEVDLRVRAEAAGWVHGYRATQTAFGAVYNLAPWKPLLGALNR